MEITYSVSPSILLLNVSLLPNTVIIFSLPFKFLLTIPFRPTSDKALFIGPLHIQLQSFSPPPLKAYWIYKHFQQIFEYLAFTKLYVKYSINSRHVSKVQARLNPLLYLLFFVGLHYMDLLFLNLQVLWTGDNEDGHHKITMAIIATYLKENLLLN